MAVTGGNNLTETTQFNYAVHTEATVAVGTPENSVLYDMQNYDEMAFVVTIGGVNASGTLNIKAQESDTSVASDATDITGASVDIAAATNNHIEIMALTTNHFTKRYLRVVITATGANSTHVTCVAVRSKALRTSSVDNA